MSEPQNDIIDIYRFRAVFQAAVCVDAADKNILTE
jgi:hypothetical protein